MESGYFTHKSDGRPRQLCAASFPVQRSHQPRSQVSSTDNNKDTDNSEHKPATFPLAFPAQTTADTGNPLLRPTKTGTVTRVVSEHLSNPVLVTDGVYDEVVVTYLGKKGT